MSNSDKPDTMEALRTSVEVLELVIDTAEKLREDLRKALSDISDRDLQVFDLTARQNRMLDLLRGSLPHVALNPPLEKAILKELGES